MCRLQSLDNPDEKNFSLLQPLLPDRARRSSIMFSRPKVELSLGLSVWQSLEQLDRAKLFVFSWYDNGPRTHA